MAKKETKEERTARNKAEFAERRRLAKEEAKKNKEAKANKVKGLEEFADKKIEYSERLADKICELIESGLSLRDIGKIAGMPKPSTIVLWTQEHESFDERYAKSKELAVDIEFEEIKEIADEEPEKIYDAQGNKIYDKTAILWRQQRIDVRKFRTVKLNRKKYGDSIAIDDVPPAGKIDVPARESREEWLLRQGK